jgi:hypothetical protein
LRPGRCGTKKGEKKGQREPHGEIP